MYKKKKIAVVIPAYNEEQLVTKVIRSTPKFVDTIVVIDDHSTDNTALIVQKHRSAHSNKILLIRHKHNLGVGGAIATGYIWCRDHGVDVAVVNRDVKSYALMLGVPARQAGWMSSFGERISLALSGRGEYRCPRTQETYFLDGDILRVKKKS